MSRCVAIVLAALALLAVAVPASGTPQPRNTSIAFDATAATLSGKLHLWGK